MNWCNCGLKSWNLPSVGFLVLCWKAPITSIKIFFLKRFFSWIPRSRKAISLLIAWFQKKDSAGKLVAKWHLEKADLLPNDTLWFDVGTRLPTRINLMRVFFFKNGRGKDDFTGVLFLLATLLAVCSGIDMWNCGLKKLSCQSNNALWFHV